MLKTNDPYPGTRAEDQPLHIALFPPYANPTTNPTSSTFEDPSSEEASPIFQSSIFGPSSTSYTEFSYILSSSLDIFVLRARDRTRVDQDLGLLYAVDERLSVWGWETPTRTKFVIVLDAWGRPEQPGGGDGDTRYLPGMGGGGGLAWGMKDGDLKPAFRALQTAYIRLLQNPFYIPDEHNPAAYGLGPERSGMIYNKKFMNEVNRIGLNWQPGVTNL